MSLRHVLSNPARAAARLGLKRGEVSVSIVDISREGARLDIAPSIMTPVNVGDRLSLAIEGLTVRAEVRWRLGRQAGVLFDQPLPDEVHERVTGDGRSSVQARRKPARRGGMAVG